VRDVENPNDKIFFGIERPFAYYPKCLHQRGWPMCNEVEGKLIRWCDAVQIAGEGSGGHLTGQGLHS